MTCTLIVIDTFTMLWNGACRILTPAGSASHVIPKIGPHKFIALRAGGDIAVAIGPLWDDNYYHADIRRAVACTDPKWRVSGGGYVDIHKDAATGAITANFWGSSGSYGNYDRAIATDDAIAAIAAALGTDAANIYTS